MNSYKLFLTAIVLIVALTGCGGCQSKNNPSEVKDTTGRTVEPSRPCVPNPDTSALDMHTIYQEEDNWCWAACGEMVMEFKDSENMTQCGQVNDLLDGRNCCEDPLPGECNLGGIPQFTRYGFSVDSISRALTLEEIKEQIDCKRSPICAIWNYRFLGSHMVVVSGYTKIEGQDYVIVRNPSRNYIGVEINFINYSEYDSSGYYTHGMDYYNIAKQ